MKVFRKHLRDWFGYDRRERRATLFVVILLVLAGFSRYLVPGSQVIPEISILPVQDSTEMSERESTNAISDPVPTVALATPPQRSQSPVIELNSCDSIDLKQLRGIGPVLSARVVKYRNLLGGFCNKCQLLEVYGLKKEVYDNIAINVRVDTTFLRKLHINTDDYTTLVRHPYLKPEQVSSIIRYRERHGSITSWDMVVENGLLPGEIKEYLRSYISYDSR